jgi:hypothetical protein
MVRAASSSSSPNPGRNAQASGAGTKENSRVAQTASKPGASSSDPALKRSKSLPARLPSDPLRPAEVKADRKPITRLGPDRRYTRESYDFRRQAGGRRAGAELKKEYMDDVKEMYPTDEWIRSEISWNPDHMDLIKSVHPKFGSYSHEQKMKAFYNLVRSHPGLLAGLAKRRTQTYGVPNYPTSSRLMEPDEQQFLTRSMKLIQEDVERKPFHIHGESGAVGDKNGEIQEFTHNPKGSVTLTIQEGNRYAMHSHPPYMGPFTSSASDADHKVAAMLYSAFDNKMSSYVTNGKDVLQIPSDSLQLIKLHPDPEAEKTLGKFPEAFRVPDPQTPPRPFANHEAPAAFKKDWEPPAGWTPPQDYPRGQSAG